MADAKKTAAKKTASSEEAQTGSEPTIESEGTEKLASAQRHVVKPGMNEALAGPSSDSLNPAYAPLTQEEDEKAVKALGLEDQSQGGDSKDDDNK